MICFVLVALFTVFLSCDNNVSFRNADATWHVLLTITAYEETPASIHHFVPLVTLGAESDKGIPWGRTVSDPSGNYYYTSFSAAGYVLPWAFFKLFRLPFTPKSLYLFNRLLMLFSVWLLLGIVQMIFKDEKYVSLLALGGGIIYLTAPEILHSMGMTYWHQSVYQVTFLLQLLFYLRKDYAGGAKAGFYAMCLLNPYLEWTGFVANIGFALIFAWKAPKKHFRQIVEAAMPVCLCTVLSGALLLLHYKTVMGFRDYLKVNRSRFSLRAGSLNSHEYLDLIKGYGTSFLFAWGVLAIVGVLFLALKSNDEKNSIKTPHIGEVMFLTVFPLLENLIMKRHAIGYSYDRMKLIFPIIFLFCALSAGILDKAKNKKYITAFLTGIVIAAGIANTVHYTQDGTYVWKADFFENNEKLAQKVEVYRNDSVIGAECAIRGYYNLLFHRSIIEWVSADTVVALANMEGKRYAIHFKVDSEDPGSGNAMSPIESLCVWDAQSQEWEEITI